MKNKELKCLLLLSMASMLAVTPAVYGELDASPEAALEDVTPVPQESVQNTEDVPGLVTPQPENTIPSEVTPFAPEEPSVIVTPVEPSTTATPEPSATATPVEPSATVTPAATPQVQRILTLIDALLRKDSITLEDKVAVQTVRKEYNALTPEEKVLIETYPRFREVEAFLNQLLIEAGEEPLPTESPEPGEQPGEELTSGENDAVKAVVDMVSNLHAGKEFYLSSLLGTYQLSFSEDFASVMSAIEEAYKEENCLYDSSDLSGSPVTTSRDGLLVRNWQDILAVYVYRHSLQGETSFRLDSASRGELAEIFAMMNPVIRDKDHISMVYYGNYHVEDFVNMAGVSQEGRALMNRYLEQDCSLLCAIVTAAPGFVRQSVGSGVAEERVNVISAAYSLIGKVGYFYGGKSHAYGEDPSWGGAVTVTAEGSTSTGTLRAYGLDCSGFVTWAVINGYHNTGMVGSIGHGTSAQWENARVVSEAEAQPGDLVFEDGPQAVGADNHVGILCGKTSSGDWIAVHCSSSQNGVTVGEAYSASFRYIRQPSFYLTSQELASISPDHPQVHPDLETSSPEEYLSEVLGLTFLSDDSVVESFNTFELVDNSRVEPFDVEVVPLEAETDLTEVVIPEEVLPASEQPDLLLVDNSIVVPFD